MVYTKGGALAQKENSREFPRKQKLEHEIQFGVNIGDQAQCPECDTMGRVVWVSQDRKTMGVQCRRSHHSSTTDSKFGATAVTSTKTKKNVVFLTPE